MFQVYNIWEAIMLAVLKHRMSAGLGYFENIDHQFQRHTLGGTENGKLTMEGMIGGRRQVSQHNFTVGSSSISVPVFCFQIVSQIHKTY